MQLDVRDLSMITARWRTHATRSVSIRHSTVISGSKLLRTYNGQFGEKDKDERDKVEAEQDEVVFCIMGRDEESAIVSALTLIPKFRIPPICRRLFFTILLSRPRPNGPFDHSPSPSLALRYPASETLCHRCTGALHTLPALQALSRLRQLLHLAHKSP